MPGQAVRRDQETMARDCPDDIGSGASGRTVEDNYMIE